MPKPKMKPEKFQLVSYQREVDREKTVSSIAAIVTRSYFEVPGCDPEDFQVEDFDREDAENECL